jgi:hypothetical protein
VPTVSLTATPNSLNAGSTSTLTWSSTNATSCTAGGSWSGTRATSGSAQTSALTAASTFTLTCSGAGGSSSQSTSVTVTAASGAVTGLNFPSNGDSPSNAFVAFQFYNPHQNGLPMWGPDNGGVTYIWKYRPRQQAGYYVTFWWSNNGRFESVDGKPDSYYGAHPYPRGGGTGTTTHDWEVAGLDYGSDYMTTLAGSTKQVVKDRWYTQALRIVVNADGTKTARFFIDLPSTSPSDVIQKIGPAYFGTKNPAAPALTFGDSPWYADYQHERLSGVLRGIKVFNKALSEADMLAEAASDALVTSQGLANVWYLNINPTPSDISDKSGKGHHPVWADSANKATLWTQ